MSEHAEKKGVKLYLVILQLAAKNGEDKVNTILKQVTGSGDRLDINVIRNLAESKQAISVQAPAIQPVDLNQYDCELLEQEVNACQLN